MITTTTILVVVAVGGVNVIGVVAVVFVITGRRHRRYHHRKKKALKKKKEDPTIYIYMIKETVFKKWRAKSKATTQKKTVSAELYSARHVSPVHFHSEVSVTSFDSRQVIKAAKLADVVSYLRVACSATSVAQRVLSGAGILRRLATSTAHVKQM